MIREALQKVLNETEIRSLRFDDYKKLIKDLENKSRNSVQDLGLADGFMVLLSLNKIGTFVVIELEANEVKEHDVLDFSKMKRYAVVVDDRFSDYRDLEALPLRKIPSNVNTMKKLEKFIDKIIKGRVKLVKELDNIIENHYKMLKEIDDGVESHSRQGISDKYNLGEFSFPYFEEQWDWDTFEEDIKEQFKDDGYDGDIEYVEWSSKSGTSVFIEPVEYNYDDMSYELDDYVVTDDNYSMYSVSELRKKIKLAQDEYDRMKGEIDTFDKLLTKLDKTLRNMTEGKKVGSTSNGASYFG